MKHSLLIAFYLLAAPLFADTFPAHFYVTGVANNDLLNVRSLPSTSTEILKTYTPYTINIEVLETTTDGSWGKVGAGETNGWVAMRYLARSTTNAPNEVPRPMSCFGTEPFWSLNLTQRGDEFEAPEIGRQDLTPTDMIQADKGFYLEFEGSERIFIRRGQCSDGMSDRAFGWQSTALYFDQSGPVIANGCCTLDASD